MKIAIDEDHDVSALLRIPAAARACYVMAHGAGAGMTHSFLEAVADGLFERQIATLRYQFPYMEAGSKRPDRPPFAQATVRAVVREAERHAPSLPLFAGGKSFGGRMISQAQAEAPLDGVRGLIFLGFPLHPANKPATGRADHLAQVRVPMLFLQGTRDALADVGLIRPLVAKLGALATLSAIEDGDHSFKVPARSGRSQPEVFGALCDTIAAWIDAVDRG